MRENKVYRKPDFTMMWFTPSDNVAGCPTDVTYNEVEIPCLITQSHKIFYSSCSSNYNDLNIVKVTEDMYFNSDMQAIEYLADMIDGTQDGRYQSGSYKLAAGEYLVWTSGQTHAGLITPDITSTVNSSL